METLLVIFIGLVAAALVVIAAGVGVAAYVIVKFLQELTVITRRLHAAGEIMAGDLAEVRQQLKGGRFIYTLAKYVWPTKTPKKLPSPRE
jgi:membrane protein implicated in regulation of membrane protease activity